MQRHRAGHLLVALLTAVGVVVAAPDAGARRGSKHGLDQDQVLDAVKRGEIKPLVDVLPVVEKAAPGRVVKVEVERRQGRIVYELKIVEPNGRVREVYIDATTLEILKIE
jgi:uncharacterized membrane protein YkoI